jgi:hypothetical protein
MMRNGRSAGLSGDFENTAYCFTGIFAGAFPDHKQAKHYAEGRKENV